jgi:ubiquinone biosynthesis protein
MDEVVMRERPKVVVIPSVEAGADPTPMPDPPRRSVVLDATRRRPRADGGDVLMPLPRTNRISLSCETLLPPSPSPHRPRRPWPLPRRQREAEVFKAPLTLTVRRLLTWLHAIAYYVFLGLRDRFAGLDAEERRGIRLRETFERIGGTFLKLGQQFSTRSDLLPFQTCQELSKLLDDMSPFSLAEATAAVERATGKPFDQVFERFDPTPLGSMSIACVYHAVLKSGKEVVVKVRRPGIGTLFAADLAALDVLCVVAESLTLVRPGFTRALRTELRTMLLEELDFRSEARYQELFRNQSRRDRQPVTAPKVYYEYSGREVLVSEYVRGLWLQDLIAIEQRHDAAALEYLATLNITPKKVARHLLHGFYWSTFETLFYHADPHPGNIMVLPDSRLVLTNFGACGPTTHKSQRNYAELFRRQAKRDLDGMVQVFGNILSPLPQTDVHALLKAAEAKVARWQHGFDSKHAEWWERGSAGLWIGILEMAREWRIPVSIETVRFFRASLLCDTTVARLCEKVRGPREFARYQRGADRRARRRAVRRWNREWNAGQVLVQYQRVSDLAGRLMYRLQDLSDQPTTSFLAALNKGSFVLSCVLRLGFVITLLTSVALGLVLGGAQLSGAEIGMAQAVRLLGGSPWYWGSVCFLLLRTYRTVQYRLGDVDV